MAHRCFGPHSCSLFVIIGFAQYSLGAALSGLLPIGLYKNQLGECYWGDGSTFDYSHFDFLENCYSPTTSYTALKGIGICHHFLPSIGLASMTEMVHTWSFVKRKWFE